MNETAWTERIAEARKTRANAVQLEERTIRDAHAEGMSESAIARALGIQDRTRIRSILGKTPEGERPSQPPHTPVILITGSRKNLYDRLAPALWARGWSTTHSSQDAWYLARAGVPVVQVQMQPEHVAEIGPVQAKWRDEDMALEWSAEPHQGLHEVFDPEAVTTMGRKGAPVTDVDSIARRVALALS